MNQAQESPVKVEPWTSRLRPRVMNSGDSIFFDIARSFSLASLAFVRVVADSLSTGFGTVYEREDHLFATHFPEYGIEEVE